MELKGKKVLVIGAARSGIACAKFLAKRGPGVHHVAFNVPDIRAALAELKTKGTRLIDEEPRTGAGGCLVAFIHPSSTGGVLIELVESPARPRD